MASVVNYALVARKNPMKKEDPAKYYPQIQHSGEVTLDEMAADIEENCTATSSDIQAVIDALRKRIIRHLKEGKIVRLGALGSLRLSVSSAGAESEEKFSASLIKTSRVIYVPGGTLQEMLKVLKFQLVKKADSASGGGTGSSDPDGSDSDSDSGGGSSGGIEGI